VEGNSANFFDLHGGELAFHNVKPPVDILVKPAYSMPEPCISRDCVSPAEEIFVPMETGDPDFAVLFVLR
jgi:hypothetical protein